MQQATGGDSQGRSNKRLSDEDFRALAKSEFDSLFEQYEKTDEIAAKLESERPTARKLLSPTAA
ncbi:MAG: hypothetical protein AAFR38_00815 [Planctomycetota bacterium]